MKEKKREGLEPAGLPLRGGEEEETRVRGTSGAPSAGLPPGGAGEALVRPETPSRGKKSSWHAVPRPARLSSGGGAPLVFSRPHTCRAHST